MVKYSFVSFSAYVVTIGYLALTILALFVSYYYIAQIDWSRPIQLLKIGSSIIE